MLGLGAGPWGSASRVRPLPLHGLPLCPQALFALCSLLRHFPYAQRQFLKLGGLQILRSLVRAEGSEVLAVRVVTLLYDLATEKVSARTLPCVCHWPFGRGPCCICPSRPSVLMTECP